MSALIKPLPALVSACAPLVLVRAAMMGHLSSKSVFSRVVVIVFVVVIVNDCPWMQVGQATVGGYLPREVVVRVSV